MEQSRQYQALPLARDLLPVLDNLRRALGAAEAAGNAAELVEGVNMVVKQFEDVLARHLVVPIEAVGQPFDAHLHEAVQQVPSPDHPPMTVVAEVERGYLLHDRVVRPAKVIVSSGPPV
jgi:molecular chaperone GrpE